MFQLLKGKGFALTLADGTKLEVDFGPMSRSENINISKQAFEATGGKSRDAEIRVFQPGESRPSFVRTKASVDDLATLISGNMTSG
jgi:hypothetical protein